MMTMYHMMSTLMVWQQCKFVGLTDTGLQIKYSYACTAHHGQHSQYSHLVTQQYLLQPDE